MNSLKLVKNIRWLGNAGFLINEKPSMYIDPYNLAFPDIGDVILITDDDSRHCSPDTVKWLRKGSTIIIGPENVAPLFTGGDIRAVKPGETQTAKGAKIEVLAAFEDEKSKRAGKSAGVGYIITYPNDFSVCHLGRGRFAPPEPIENLDILLMPVGKQVALSAEQAAEITNQINPAFVIPMNWDKDSFSADELAQFKELCTPDVVQLKPKP